jgi:hypothetical protein
MTTATDEAVAAADAHLNNVGLPTYTELLGAVCDAAAVNPFGDNHNWKTQQEALKLSQKAICAARLRVLRLAESREWQGDSFRFGPVMVSLVSYACLDAEIVHERVLVDGELVPRRVRPYRVPKTRRAYGTLQAAVDAILAAPAAPAV